MARVTKIEHFVKFETREVIEAGQSLIAVSSILGAVCDQYAHTGGLSLGAILHASNVVDRVIEQLKLVDILSDEEPLPF